MAIEARKQNQDWRPVSSSYMRGYYLHDEKFYAHLIRITRGETVKIKWQEFRRRDH